MIEWLYSVGYYLLHVVLPAVLLFAVGVLAIRVGKKLVAKILERSKLESIAVNLIMKVLQVAAYVLLGLMVASKLGIDVSGIVALASVLTLAVSLSVQDLLTNLISGFTLLYTKPFTAGHYVEIAGQSGTVQEVGLTYTKLATPDNKIISIPNGAVTSAQIVNYTVTGTRRVDFAVTASYDAPVDQVIEALLQAGNVENVLPDPAPFAALRAYEDSSISYVLRLWVKNEDYWDVHFAVSKRIKEIFDRNGIQMSYPHINVHLDK